MLREEFDERIKKIGGKPTDISPAMYKNVETVYAFHPSIDEVKGKEQIAYLVVNFGYRIIADMLPTALSFQKLEDELLATRNKLNQIQKDMDEVRKGKDLCIF